MKKLIVFLSLLACGCEEPIPFKIDPHKEYTVAELGKQTTTKCKYSSPWEGQTVTVVGRVDQRNVHQDSQTAKFWLTDAEANPDKAGVIEIYIKDASQTEALEIFRFVKATGPLPIKVVGTARVSQMPTMGQCTKTIHITIASSNALSLH